MNSQSPRATSVASRFDNTDGRLRGRKLQERRLRKWTEAEGKCAGCGRLTNYADPRVDPTGFHLDHIAMLEKSKDDSEENTQVLCLPCHLTKTNEDLQRTEKVQVGIDGWPVTTGGMSASAKGRPLETAPELFFSRPHFRI